MKRILYLSILFLSSSAVFAAVPVAGSTSTVSAVPLGTSTSTVGGVTLAECYQKALEVSETLDISDQEIEQINALYRRGVGAALPTISWNLTEFWQDTSKVQQSSGGVQGTLLRDRRPESYFEARQVLFEGLRILNTSKSLKSQSRAAEFDKKQAELSLLGDVAEVFYVSLDLQQELEVLTSQKKLTDDRLKELQRRVRLGRSRDSEVLSSQVDLASLDAQIEDARQRWATARYVLRFLTEVPLNVPLIETQPVPPLPTMEAALSQSANRPDVLSAEQLQKAGMYNVKSAKGGFLPTLDVTGKYYTERVGFNEDVKWDALLFLNVPIFSNLAHSQELNFARSQQIIADLTSARLKRQAKREVETAYENLRYTVSQSELYGKAVDLAGRNYQLQQQEYKLGLINNLQVLQVLTDLQELQIQKLRSEASMRINHIRLRIATGQGI